jgi:uncharacterized OB-fold protein
MTERVPAVEWFRTEPEPVLLGRRGRRTGTYFFPPTDAAGRNPAAPDEELDEVVLSRRGRIWSWTTNHYPAPPPFPVRDPFRPYTVVAVELPAERMVVLGLLAEDVDPATLRVGAEVELDVGVLERAGDREELVWTWRPVSAAREGGS